MARSVKSTERQFRMRPVSVGGIRQLVAGFVRDTRGVAAVEFAYLCPLLMLMTFGTFEITRAIVAHKRFERATAMVGDLVAREQQIGSTILDAPGAMAGIMAAGAQVMVPYSSTPLQMTVTELRASSSDATVTKVEWSYQWTSSSSITGVNCGLQKSMPASNMVTAGNAAIVVEGKYAYTPILTNILPNIVKPMSWTNTMAYAPRYGSVFYAQATQNTRCPPGTG